MYKPMQKEKSKRSPKWGKKTHFKPGMMVRITSDFSPETMEGRRQCYNIDKVLKGKCCHPWIIYLVKISLQNESRLKILQDEQMLREFTTIRFVLQEMLRFSGCRKGIACRNSDLQEGMKSTGGWVTMKGGERRPQRSRVCDVNLEAEWNTASSTRKETKGYFQHWVEEIIDELRSSVVPKTRTWSKKDGDMSKGHRSQLENQKNNSEQQNESWQSFIITH